ncbi:hypothetical protein ACV56Z_15240 [Staphylococcus aureus]
MYRCSMWRKCYIKWCFLQKVLETLTAKFSELGVNVDVKKQRIRINNNAPYQFVDIKNTSISRFCY